MCRSRPVAPSQRRAVYSFQAETVSDEHADELASLWRDVHVEDQVICERLQEGRASAVADDGGVLSPLWEDAVRSFQERVVKPPAVSARMLPIAAAIPVQGERPVGDVGCGVPTVCVGLHR